MRVTDCGVQVVKNCTHGLIKKSRPTDGSSIVLRSGTPGCPPSPCRPGYQPTDPGHVTVCDRLEWAAKVAGAGPPAGIAITRGLGVEPARDSWRVDNDQSLITSQDVQSKQTARPLGSRSLENKWIGDINSSRCAPIDRKCRGGGGGDFNPPPSVHLGDRDE